MTDDERYTAICNALVNGVATPAQKNKLGLAFARRDLREAEYNAATTAQKTSFALQKTYDLVTGVIRNTAADAAAAAARDAAYSAPPL